MKTLRTSLLALALSSTALSAAAQQTVCYTDSIPLQPTNWSLSVSVPKFDPSLGTLNLVDVCITGQITGSYGVESLDAGPSWAMMQLSAAVELRRPDASPIAQAMPASPMVTYPLTPFDGTLDFGGTSGASQSGISVLTTAQIDLTSPADLALFTGAPGAPGSIVLPVSAMGTSTAMGGGHLITYFQSQAAGIVSICYDYTPVAAPFCAGDGTNTPCPCGNGSAVGANEGCLNSFGVGAALRGAGIASIATDSLVLTCSNLHGMTTGLFFQGTSQAGGGAGIAFGDGVRCVLGTNVRIGTKTASAGMTTYPEVGDAPISVRGAVPANSTRYYQFWYRNAASFCTSAAFNLSQGVAVQWVP